jgi:hypothetical protein
MSVSDFELPVTFTLGQFFLMVGGALLDDSESEAWKTTVTIHGEKVGCSRGNEHMKGGSITPIIRNLRTNWG